MNLLYNEILPITGTIQWWGAILCFNFLPVLKGEADVVDAVDGGGCRQDLCAKLFAGSG